MYVSLNYSLDLLGLFICIYFHRFNSREADHPSIPNHHPPGPKAAVKGADKSSQIKTEVKGEGPILMKRKVVQKQPGTGDLEDHPI